MGTRWNALPKLARFFILWLVMLAIFALINVLFGKPSDLVWRNVMGLVTAGWMSAIMVWARAGKDDVANNSRKS